MKFLTHPIAVYAAKLLVYAALSAGVFILMDKHYRTKSDPKAPEADTARMRDIELILHINDSNLQQIKSNVDSILYQTQANEATLKRIRSSRTSANSHISTMSSVDLTRALSNRYRDSL